MNLSYQQGYPSQQPTSPQQPIRLGPPQQQREQQQIKFYKSGFFAFSSAPGRFERDVPHMQTDGWRLQSVFALGTNLLMQKTFVATWVR